MRRVRVSQQFIQIVFASLFVAATSLAAPSSGAKTPTGPKSPAAAAAAAAAKAATSAPLGPVGPWAAHVAVPYPITSDTVRDRTDFSATYRRGSENLSLHILYIQNKLGALKTLEAAKGSSGSAGDQAWIDGVKDMIGAFCLPSEKPDDCYARYLVVQKHTLQAMRAEIKRSHLNVAELQGSRALSGGRSPASAGDEASPALPVSVSNPGQLPYRSRPMTYTELQEYYTQEAAKLDTITKPEYEEWAKSLTLPPAKAGFVMLKKKNSPEGADQYELDRSCGSDICYDEKAFVKAVDDFEKKKDASGKTEMQKLEDARVEAEKNKPLALTVKRSISSVGAASVQAFSAASQAIEDASRKQSSANPTKAVFISVDADTFKTAADPEATRIP